MKLYFIILCLFIYRELSASEHSLSAHEHGMIKLAMAYENKVLDIDLNGPTESFVGFEYLPRTANEKKKFSEVKTLWEKKLFTLITLDKKLGCKITESSFTQVIDEKETKEAQSKILDLKKREMGIHSDIEAKAKINCAIDPVGSEVQVSLKKHFSNILKLVVELIGVETKSIEITKPIQSFKL